MKIIVFLIFHLFIPTVSGGQAIMQYPTGCPELDLYYERLQNNTHDAEIVHERHLLETVSTDSLIIAFIKRGHDTYHDPANLYLLFNAWHSPLSEENKYMLLDKLYTVSNEQESEQLELLADMFRASLMGTGPDYDKKMELSETVISKARKMGDIGIEAMILDEMCFESYCYKEYIQHFTYIKRLEEALEKAGDNYFRKSTGNFRVGKAYYEFKDYDRALPFLRKVENAEGWNYLAVYHQQNGNLDSAAYYHRQILLSKEHPIVLAIAISNLGRIHLIQGNTAGAIAMLKAGLDYMEKTDDSSFTTGICISLGEAYLSQGNRTAAKEYIDRARNLTDKLTTAPLHYRLTALYALESQYYALAGDYGLAKSCQDSSLVSSARYEQVSGQHIILLAEQELQKAEVELKSQQIARQKEVIGFVIIALLLLTAILLVTMYYYRRQQAAYKKLAQQARKWAVQSEIVIQTTNTETNGNTKAEPTEDDLHIIKLADHEMTKNHTYREAGLTVETLADRLGVHRNTLARAISRTKNKNFNLYTNEYRIKEAVRIISESSRKELYIEELSERVGFGNRSTFSRVFKQFTGLSPVDFQKQKGKSQQEDKF